MLGCDEDVFALEFTLRELRGQAGAHPPLRLLVVVDEGRVDGAVPEVKRHVDGTLRVLRLFELRVWKRGVRGQAAGDEGRGQ